MSWQTLQLGAHNLAVEGLTRGLVRALGHAASCRSEQELFDAHVQRDVVLLQERAGLAKDGVVGAATWTALGKCRTPGGSPALDERAKGLIRASARPHTPTPAEAKQLRILAAQNYYLAHAGRLTYAEVRPYPFFSEAGTVTDAQLVRGTDCSGSTTGTSQHGGAKDPNGRGYDGQGFTGSMRAYAEAHGLVIPLSKVRIGDLIHYDDPDHVSQSRENVGGAVTVPKVFTFGSEPARIDWATYRTVVMCQRLELG